MADGPLIDIRPDHWAIVSDILRKQVPQYDVWAFGSRAKWTAKQYSDLDLAVITDKPLPLAVSAALSDDFSESDLPWRVDVVDWATTSASFRKIIERDKVVVQKAKAKRGMANEWRATTLGEVASFLSGGTPSKANADFWNGDVPWLSAKDMKSFFIRDTEDHVTASGANNGTRTVPAGTIFMLTRGMTLLNDVPICVAQCAMTFNQDVKAIRAREGVASDYLAYLLLSRKPQLLGMVDLAGHGTGRLNSDSLKALEIVIPNDIEEQRAIARILGALDDRIELNRRTNETLEAMARALFKSWFVDFDGVAESNLVESELGLIPKGWIWVPANELIEFNPTEPMRRGTLAPYLDMAALPTVGSWPEPPVQREFGSGMRFRNGDTLLARITPCLENGKTTFVQCLPEGAVAWGSTEFIVMRPKTPVPAQYAYLLARDTAFREHAIRSMTGTSGRQRVQADSVAEFKLASPPDTKIWLAFADFVAPLFKTIKANAEAAQTLVHLRDAILPKLFSGELRVSEAERIAETA